MSKSPTNLETGFATRVSRTLHELQTASGDQWLNPRVFFTRVLQTLSQDLELSSSIIWMLDSPTTFRPFVKSPFDSVSEKNPLTELPENQSILQATVLERRVNLRSLGDVQKFEFDAVLSIPLIRHGQCVSVIQLCGSSQFLDFETEAGTRAIDSLRDCLDRFLEAAEQTPAPSNPRSAADYEEYRRFTEALHRTLDLESVCQTIVNDALLMLDVDRATLLFRSGRRWQTIAISGQSRVNRRMSQVRKLESFARVALIQNSPIRFDDTVEEIPARLRDSLAEYLDDSQCRLLHLIPLVSDVRGAESTKSPGRSQDIRPHMALLLEQFRDSSPSERCSRFGMDYCEQATLALRNARRFARVPFRRILAPERGGFPGSQSRSLSAWLIGGMLLIVAAFSLCCLDLPYRVQANGRLVPSIHRRVYAPASGNIGQLQVTDGETVRAGQVMLVMRDPRIEAELLELRNRLTAQSRQLLAIRSRWHREKQTSSRSELLDLQVQQEQIEIGIKGIEQQIEHLETSSRDLEIRSPIAGVVVLAQPEHELQGQPVNRGDVLLEVFNVDSPWVLDVDFEEHRYGHVRDAVDRHPEGRLPATYLLKSDPSRKYHGRLIQVDDHTSPRTGRQTTVRATVATQPDRPLHEHLGADVEVRIDCGPRVSGYVLFGDVFEFFQRTLWL